MKRLDGFWNPYRCRVLLAVLCPLFFLTAFYLSGANATIMGVRCSDCHTMHNSENGKPVAKSAAGNPIPNAYESLLKYGCVGCHTSQTSGTIITAFGNTPIVNNTIEPIKPLAGGNFYYVGLDSMNGHNIPPTPDPYLSTPPGGAFINGGYKGQLRCSGTRGCHGYNGGHGETPEDNGMRAMGGAHHGVDTPPLDGSTVAKSFRYLYGIKGKGDSRWEQDNLNTSHNEYKGSTNRDSTDTMSYFCSECHGNFHDGAGIGTNSPWLRHPTDVLLPLQTEYAQYTIYNTTVPVARPDPDNVNDTTKVIPGQDIVMCLSCHRAHASPYYKALRWDYKNTNLSTALSGCGICHTSKQ